MRDCGQGYYRLRNVTSILVRRHQRPRSFVKACIDLIRCARIVFSTGEAVHPCSLLRLPFRPLPPVWGELLNEWEKPPAPFKFPAEALEALGPAPSAAPPAPAPDNSPEPERDTPTSLSGQPVQKADMPCANVVPGTGGGRSIGIRSAASPPAQVQAAHGSKSSASCAPGALSLQPSARLERVVGGQAALSGVTDATIAGPDHRTGNETVVTSTL
ncbi:hypothetical protein JCM3774_000645 [Rhodotorula dairenensis]